MISVSDLTVRFGPQVLFQNVSWQLTPGARYGLVGANGTGKSTLIRVMTGELPPEAGAVSLPSTLRLGVLHQDHFRNDDQPLIDVVLRGKPRLWAALHEKAALLAKAGASGEAGLDERDGRKLGELEAVIADNGGYTAEALAATLLTGLGLEEARHRLPMKELSGGYRLRVLLAQTLFEEPELLLLDEPTNHLDIISIRWLESYLQAFPGTFVLVSHDRHFLNAVCDHVADLDYQELRLYPGNYDAFVAAKSLAEEQKGREIARTEKRIAEMQQFIDRFRYKATKARQAQSRVKQVERMEIPEITRSSRRFPSFAFRPKRASGREALTVKGVAKAYGGRPVLTDIELEVTRGDKLAVVGPNGIGKSTLLKIIVGEVAPEVGEATFGYEVSAGYFSQDHEELNGARGSAFEWLYGRCPGMEIGTVRGILGRVLLSGEEADKPVSALSGGESTRLRLALLMAHGHNTLVLDEPTNHLDLEGREALMEALLAFPGTLILVSHDRHFVSTVATRVLALTPEGVEDFHGTYEEYLERQGADYLTVEGARLAAPSPARPKDGGAKDGSAKTGGAKEEYTARRERKRESSRLRKKVEKLEREVAALEGEVAAIDRRFAEQDYYDKTSWEQMERDQRGKKAAARKLEAVVAEWEAAAGELEQLAAGE